MSPKSRQPIEDDPDDLTDDPAEAPDIPPGYVPVGRPSGQAPAKTRLSVWWGVAGFVVAVAAAITVIVVVSKPTDPRTEPGTTATAFTDALNKHDMAAVETFLCGDTELQPDDTAYYQAYRHAEVAGVRQDYPDRAVMAVSDDMRMEVLVARLRTEGELWCVYSPTVCPGAMQDPSGAPELCGDRPR